MQQALTYTCAHTHERTRVRTCHYRSVQLLRVVRIGAIFRRLEYTKLVSSESWWWIELSVACLICTSVFSSFLFWVSSSSVRAMKSERGTGVKGVWFPATSTAETKT